jgi:hypothetical protein
VPFCQGHAALLRSCSSAAHAALQRAVPQVATLRGHPLYRVTSTQVLADTRGSKWTPADKE